MCLFVHHSILVAGVGSCSFDSGVGQKALLRKLILEELARVRERMAELLSRHCQKLMPPSNAQEDLSTPTDLHGQKSKECCD